MLGLFLLMLLLKKPLLLMLPLLILHPLPSLNPLHIPLLYLLSASNVSAEPELACPDPEFVCPDPSPPNRPVVLDFFVGRSSTRPDP